MDSLVLIFSFAFGNAWLNIELKYQQQSTLTINVKQGYDIGVSTNAGPKIQVAFGLDDEQLELFLGSLNFWSIFGALLSPFVTDRYGRRATFRTAALAFMFGCGIMATSPSFEVLMMGRMIVGLGVGVGEGT